MTNFALGIVVGLLFAIIAVITGKKLEKSINDPKYTVGHINNSVFVPKAQIIKTNDDIEDFLDDNKTTI